MQSRSLLQNTFEILADLSVEEIKALNVNDLVKLKEDTNNKIENLKTNDNSLNVNANEIQIEEKRLKVFEGTIRILENEVQRLDDILLKDWGTLCENAGSHGFDAERVGDYLEEQIRTLITQRPDLFIAKDLFTKIEEFASISETVVHGSVTAYFAQLELATKFLLGINVKKDDGYVYNLMLINAARIEKNIDDLIGTRKMNPAKYHTTLQALSQNISDFQLYLTEALSLSKPDFAQIKLCIDKIKNKLLASDDILNLEKNFKSGNSHVEKELDENELDLIEKFTGADLPKDDLLKILNIKHICHLKVVDYQKPLAKSPLLKVLLFKHQIDSAKNKQLNLDQLNKKAHFIVNDLNELRNDEGFDLLNKFKALAELDMMIIKSAVNESPSQFEINYEKAKTQFISENNLIRYARINRNSSPSEIQINELLQLITPPESLLVQQWKPLLLLLASIVKNNNNILINKVIGNISGSQAKLQELLDGSKSILDLLQCAKLLKGNVASEQKMVGVSMELDKAFSFATKGLNFMAKNKPKSSGNETTISSDELISLLDKLINGIESLSLPSKKMEQMVAYLDNKTRKANPKPGF